MQTLYQDRLARVARQLQGARVDALLLTPGAPMFYLSGFEHGHAAERLLALGQDLVDARLDEVVEDVDFTASLERVVVRPSTPQRPTRTLRVLSSVGSFGR